MFIYILCCNQDIKYYYGIIVISLVVTCACLMCLLFTELAVCMNSVCSTLHSSNVKDLVPKCYIQFSKVLANSAVMETLKKDETESRVEYFNFMVHAHIIFNNVNIMLKTIKLRGRFGFGTNCSNFSSKFASAPFQSRQKCPSTFVIKIKWFRYNLF